MKMTNDNKLKIVTLSHNIKALCYILDKRTFSEHCVEECSDIETIICGLENSKKQFSNEVDGIDYTKSF